MGSVNTGAYLRTAPCSAAAPSSATCCAPTSRQTIDAGMLPGSPSHAVADVASREQQAECLGQRAHVVEWRQHPAAVGE